MEVSANVYERMRSERARVAREFRARGEKEAITIRADADRQRIVISAAAYKDAEEMRVRVMPNRRKYTQRLIIKIRNFMIFIEA